MVQNGSTWTNLREYFIDFIGVIIILGGSVFMIQSMSYNFM
jgi:hypothetical protein